MFPRVSGVAFSLVPIVGASMSTALVSLPLVPGCLCLTRYGCSGVVLLHVVVETRTASTPGMFIKICMLLGTSFCCFSCRMSVINETWMFSGVGAARGC